MYKYIQIDNENRIKRILIIEEKNFSSNWIQVSSIPESFFNYKYINGEYIYDPIPKEENPKQETELEQLKKRVAELEKQATVAGG